MSNDKHRREKKREEKRKALAKKAREADRITADVNERDIECWLIDAWEAEGWYDLNVLRRLASGRHVLGVIGINDSACACGEADLVKDADSAGFHNNFLPDMRERYAVQRLTLKEARELASGAIEWTKLHGFRVPTAFVEAAAVLGSLADALPDYEGFSNAFDGTLVQLRESLPVGTSVATFLRRTDVRFLFLPETESPDVSDEDRIAQAVADAWKQHSSLILNEADELRESARTYMRAAQALSGKASIETVIRVIDPNRVEEIRSLSS
ncbi:MAG: hypothetical protein QM770_23720 [Tepidisphaeraceae bacterium]